MRNILIILISFCYIFFVLFLSAVVSKFTKKDSEVPRKLIHILVGNWVFLTPMHTELWAVLFVPFAFIIINSLNLKYKFLSSMERSDTNPGTVYYAVSLFFLSGASFILGWKSLSFIGILIMAYGDGLAALTGKKWGSIKPFSFAREKSLVGFLTVLIFSFVITAACLYVFAPSEIGRELSLFSIVLIALCTAFFSAFVEITGKNGADNLSLPIGSALFASLLMHYGSLGFYIYILASVLILFAAYKARAIKPDGIVAAIITAMTLYALGGTWMGLSLIGFFVAGSFVSFLKNQTKRKAEELQEDNGPRSWIQVLCNSLPACILLWLFYFFPEKKVFLLLSFAVFSAANADTFSSELGMLWKGRVFNILNGKKLERGLSGGVSWAGFCAGLLGSVLLSLFALPQFGLRGVIFIAVLGFAGSLIDSYLGAAFQRKYKTPDGVIWDKNIGPSAVLIRGYKLISNNTVNLFTLISVSVLGYLAAHYFCRLCF
ncbi:DUF92 domain-containing protein [Treponema sp. OMZ 792]|uniref:DUF92 domain-containing protein n=1 Tax=unclassified Treponema TaxID=2638727 RepID=UPI0020A2343A|nr:MULTISPECIES: DUF92 domain-containing protein [unclassified Treponema]UTC75831.1 DUF92 domain-containing protein [Treponema sp. OMZ 792]UTC78364.1 DUF92 domain-containing protein [Treponema sp. OMZ 799]UTC79832.1 DUF92 domain-containing protein [Treponema sp. OMZ 798]